MANSTMAGKTRERGDSFSTDDISRRALPLVAKGKTPWPGEAKFGEKRMVCLPGYWPASGFYMIHCILGMG